MMFDSTTHTNRRYVWVPTTATSAGLAYVRPGPEWSLVVWNSLDETRAPRQSLAVRPTQPAIEIDKRSSFEIH